MKTSPFHGLLVVDKPGGITSRDAVDRAQRWFPRSTRVGHAGTLDPLATGVLVLCVGTATRLTEYVQRMAKTYRAGILLGARSDTDDADGTVTTVPVERPPDLDAVRACLQGFLGQIEQIPPAYSAAHVTGRRAYDLARRGEEVELRPRAVQIHAIELLAYSYPRLELEVTCSKGTYIRSLARDLGERLGCGGLIETLRRTRIGPFHADDALTLDADAAAARGRLLPVSAAVSELPRVSVTAPQAARLRQGQEVPLSGVDMGLQGGEEGAEVAVFDPAGVLVAVGRAEAARTSLAPLKVLPEPAR
jgi:tRNA pseudouridine55 synthase